MIPTKQTKRKKEAPCSDAQKLSQKENFSLFQIKGMIAQCKVMASCPTVPQSSLLSVINTLGAIEKKIKHTQAKRKEERKANG